MEEQPKAKFVVSYRRSTDYRFYPATGAFGGPTPDGAVFFNLFVEHPANPVNQTFEIVGSGVDLTKPAETLTTANMERELVCGVVLNKATARNLANWLNGVVDQMDQQGR